jgi:hypothetical protein
MLCDFFALWLEPTVLFAHHRPDERAAFVVRPKIRDAKSAKKSSQKNRAFRVTGVFPEVLVRPCERQRSQLGMI